VSRNLLRFLTTAAGLPDIRLKVAQKIEGWIQNPKVGGCAYPYLHSPKYKLILPPPSVHPSLPFLLPPFIPPSLPSLLPPFIPLSLPSSLPSSLPPSSLPLPPSSPSASLPPSHSCVKLYNMCIYKPMRGGVVQD